MSSFSLEEITGHCVHVARSLRLRYEIWRAETDLRPDVLAAGLISDPHDAHARHWAAFDRDEMVAAARMCLHDQQEETPDAPAFAHLRLPTPVLPSTG